MVSLIIQSNIKIKMGSSFLICIKIKYYLHNPNSYYIEIVRSLLILLCKINNATTLIYYRNCKELIDLTL